MANINSSDIANLPKNHPFRQKVERAMTADNLKNLQRRAGGKSARKEPEHELQVEAVDLFAAIFPKHKGRLFAIPNGGARNRVVGGKLKAEGVMAGVWDLFFAHPVGQYGGCWIETKAGDNSLSDTQLAFREELAGDYDFFVYRTIPQFVEGLQNYMQSKPNTHLNE